MRTKIGKRIGPVPIAVVAALALAAFLSVGLLTLTPTTPNGVPTAEAQGYSDTTALTVEKCEVDTSSSSEGIHSGPCNTTADQLEVTVYRTADAGAAAAGFRVYVTGGSDFGSVWASGSSTSNDSNTSTVDVANRIGKRGVDQHEFQFDTTVFAKRQEQKFTVTRGMADAKGEVYLFVYAASEDNNSGLTSTSTALTGNPGNSLKVKFVGKPAFGVDSVCDMDKTVDSNGNTVATTPTPAGCPISPVTEIRSQVVATSNGNSIVTDANTDGKAASHPEITLTADDHTSVTVTATVKDAANNPLKGEVTFTVTSNPPNIASATRTRDTATSGGNAGQASYVVSDLKNDDSFRVEVAVMFKGGTGNLDMGKVIIARAGKPAKIVGDTYNLACLTDTDIPDNPPSDYARTYTGDTFNKNNKGCAADDRFAVGDVVVVKANLEDVLTNPRTGDLTVELEDMDNPLHIGAAVTAAATQPDSAKVWVYTVDKDASLGDHDIILSSTEKDDDDETLSDLVLTVAVAGSPDSYAISGPDHIALDGSGEYTITATDENGGIPAFVVAATATDATPRNDTVRVLAQPATALVTGSKYVGTTLTLNADTGAGKVTIFAPLGAKQGDAGRIIVGSGDMQQIMPITFGVPNTAPTAVGTITDIEVTTTGSHVIDATSYFNDADAGDTLTYTAKSDDETYAFVSVYDNERVWIDGVAAGTANITITATDTSGETATQTFMVTVSEAMLGAPTDVRASPVTQFGASDIQVLWNPGANAEGHYVALLDENISYLIVDLVNLGADAGSYKFSNVSSGTYKVAVLSYRIDDAGVIEYGFVFDDIRTVTMP